LHVSDHRARNRRPFDFPASVTLVSKIKRSIYALWTPIGDVGNERADDGVGTAGGAGGVEAGDVDAHPADVGPDARIPLDVVHGDRDGRARVSYLLIVDPTGERRERALTGACGPVISAVATSDNL